MKLPTRSETKAIIVHHSQGPSHQTVAAIRDFHTRPVSAGGRGWSDIAYHWLIRKGVAIPGRHQDAVGSHAPGWNRTSVAVCLIGDYSVHAPPDPQWSALVVLVRRLLREYPGARVLGHREAMAEVGRPHHTTCPGAVDMVRLRHEVQKSDRPEWAI